VDKARLLVYQKEGTSEGEKREKKRDVTGETSLFSTFNVSCWRKGKTKKGRREMT